MAVHGFKLGGEDAELIEVAIQQRSIPDATDYWDGNWLVGNVRVEAGGFRGGFTAYFRTEELLRFRNELGLLHTTLRGTAAFEPMEEQLILRLEGDGKGHIAVSGEAQDVAGTGNRLQFKLHLDQTALPAVLRSLDDALIAFPVRGNPAA